MRTGLGRGRNVLLLSAAAAAALLFVTWFVVREVRDRQNRDWAFPVVRDLGGRIGTLPAWPFGDEIVVSFYGTQFQDGDQKRLVALNPLRGRNSVCVFLHDTNLSRDDVRELRALMPHIPVYRTIGQEQLRD
jgi:hypothetical protein